jgi:signal transduction histidine kinase
MSSQIREKSTVIQYGLQSLEETATQGLQVIVKKIDNIKMLVLSSKLMKNLMLDLLDLAQLDNNTFKLNKSFFNITQAI